MGAQPAGGVMDGSQYWISAAGAATVAVEQSGTFVLIAAVDGMAKQALNHHERCCHHVPLQAGSTRSNKHESIERATHTGVKEGEQEAKKVQNNHERHTNMSERRGAQGEMSVCGALGFKALLSSTWKCRTRCRVPKEMSGLSAWSISHPLVATHIFKDHCTFVFLRSFVGAEAALTIAPSATPSSGPSIGLLVAVIVLAACLLLALAIIATLVYFSVKRVKQQPSGGRVVPAP